MLGLEPTHDAADAAFGAALPPESGEPGSAAWSARLTLGFETRGARTVLATRRHHGPLRVQKALYQEDERVCQTVVVHPPGGIVGGDRLELDIDVGPGAHALVTTPGATKWYRAPAVTASQEIRLRVAAAGVLEWLPQESIVYDGARASQRLEVDLHPGARYVGWEVTCLGRTAAGERFDSGLLRQRAAVRLAGRPLFLEYAHIDGGGALLHSAAAMAGRVVSAIMLIAAEGITRELMAALRCAPVPAQDLAGITALPGAGGLTAAVVARYLGGSAQAARSYFAALWAIARPPLLGRAFVPPRIWQC